MKARPERLALLQRMCKDWPFFRTLLSNLDMVLAKSDLRIAMRYVEQRVAVPGLIGAKPAVSTH